MTQFLMVKPRQCGKSFSHALLVEIRLLNLLFDAQQPVSVSDLEMALHCTRRDLWTAFRKQHVLGNVKKGQPVTLTSSARIAIQAGRFATPAVAA